jgi:hypothetical protein
MNRCVPFWLWLSRRKREYLYEYALLDSTLTQTWGGSRKTRGTGTSFPLGPILGVADGAACLGVVAELSRLLLSLHVTVGCEIMDTFGRGCVCAPGRVVSRTVFCTCVRVGRLSHSSRSLWTHLPLLVFPGLGPLLFEGVIASKALVSARSSLCPSLVLLAPS